MPRVVIVDDEPLVRERLKALLLKHPDFTLVAEYGDGRAALAGLPEARPDLLLLDIQMPELDGFELLAALDSETLPAVIFVTAYDGYAVRAFEVNAVDYLLKPLDRSRFDAALGRARQRLAEGREKVDAELRAFLARQSREQGFASRLIARSSGRIAFVPVADIDWIDAAGNYVRLHAAGSEYLLREPLKALLGRLDPNRFLRVHRSVIVNLERVTAMEPYFHGEYIVTLRDGTRLTSSRTHSGRLRELLR